MRIWLPIILGMTVFLSGCTQLQLLPYLDQALLLKGFGEEKAAQHKYVDNVGIKFDKLRAVIQSGQIKSYKTEKDIIKQFGTPILASTVSIDGVSLKQCLYRYAIQNKGPYKVYLYYDAEDRLVKWESL